MYWSAATRLNLPRGISPASWNYRTLFASKVSFAIFRFLTSTQVYLRAGLEVTANRLFGPQPHTATYICIWSFYLGAVIGSVPPSFLQALSRAGSSIEHNFSDLDNSLPPDFTVPLDPDATFLTVDFHSIDLAIRGLGTAVQIALENGVTILFDDLASSPFLKHINVDVPSACIRFLAPLFGRAAPWMEVASLDADFSVVLGLSSSGWADRALLQRDFIEAQDALTRRCAFLYGQESACAYFIPLRLFSLCVKIYLLTRIS